MSKPFNNLIKKMPVERQERIKQNAKKLKTQMALGELRRALELTQKQVAGSLNMNQAAISKFEHQISDHQQTCGYEEGPSKGPGPRSAGDR